LTDTTISVAFVLFPALAEDDPVGVELPEWVPVLPAAHPDTTSKPTVATQAANRRETSDVTPRGMRRACHDDLRTR
jgi:hypothetical protein